MPKMTNPLRYPGGKRFLVDYVATLIKSNDLAGTTIYEPFAGSAAVSLEMLNRELVQEAVLIEKDPLIYSFWAAVINQPEDLCAMIDETEITIETWERLTPLRTYQYPWGNTLELGFAGLFFNRTNYSGIIMANPLGGRSQASDYTLDCRFNKERVKEQIRLVAEYRNRISVEWQDAQQFLRNNINHITAANHFVYVDPPYYQKGKSLYRHFYTDADHTGLARILRDSHFPWLLSYDNHPFIRDLYHGQVPGHQTFYKDSFINSRARGTELLISNLEIPPIEALNRTAEASS